MCLNSLKNYQLFKDEGNKRFKAKDFNGALNFYSKAIEAKGNEAAAFANRAACHLNLHNYFNVLSDCNKAIELNTNFSKAYYRRATALRELSRFNLARKDFQKVVDLEGDNQSAKQIKEIEHILANNTRLDLKIFFKPDEFASKNPMQSFKLNNQYRGSELYSLNMI